MTRSIAQSGRRATFVLLAVVGLTGYGMTTVPPEAELSHAGLQRVLRVQRVTLATSDKLAIPAKIAVVGVRVRWYGRSESGPFRRPEMCTPSA